MSKIFVILPSVLSTIEGCFVQIYYYEIMERLLSALSRGFLCRTRLFKKCKEFLCFAQMHQLWLWKLLMCFQTKPLTIILKVINLVLQFWIIPHLVFTVLRKCSQIVQEKNAICQRPHEILNQGYGCWGISGIGITNLDLLHTIVIDYSTSSFMMRRFSSKKFNLVIFQEKYFPQTVNVTPQWYVQSNQNVYFFNVSPGTRETCLREWRILSRKLFCLVFSPEIRKPSSPF